MFIDGETVNAPGRNDKDNPDTISVNALRYRVCQCLMEQRTPGYDAALTVVHRDRGVTTFREEWIRQSLLQYTSLVCIRMVSGITRELSLEDDRENVILQFSSCEMGIHDVNFPTHLDRSTTAKEDYSTRELGVLMSTTRNIEFPNGLAYTVINTENRLCNLENSNVIRDDTREEENYQSLTAKYSDQYSSTETKGYHMILGQSVYIDASINVIKYAIVEDSIYGGARDLDFNCGYTET